jgi:hypothetical protein
MPVTGLMMQAIRNGGAQATPSPTPTPSPSNYGWNFRATLAGPASFTGDVAPDVWVDPAATFVAGTTSGFIGGAPGTAAGNASYGAKACGYESLVNSSGRYLGLTAPGGIAAGNYKLRLCMGLDFGATGVLQSICIWDGYCGISANADFSPWAAGGSFPVNGYCVYQDKLYQKQTAGTQTAGATPPTHASGTVSDGTILWTFIKQAAFYIEATTTAAQFLDASGVSRAPASWQTTNALSAAAFAITQNFITETRSASTVNYNRHIGLIGQ